MDEGDHDKRRTQGKPGIVICRRSKCLRISPQEHDSLLSQKKHQKPDDHACRQQNIKAERTDPPHLFAFVFSHQDGEEGASALGENIAEGHQKCKYGRSQRYAGDNICVPRLSDEKSVGQIVYQGHHQTHYQRDRKLKIRSDNIFILKDIIFHRFFLFEEYPLLKTLQPISFNLIEYSKFYWNFYVSCVTILMQKCFFHLCFF